MTGIFFVRHAQPDESWEDDRTRPLTALGIKDSLKVTEILEKFKIDIIYSSPFKRSIDTISDYINKYNMTVFIDERFRERKRGIKSNDLLEKRWDDFSFCEENGENLESVQKRNIEALTEVLNKHTGKNIVIGTHGTALSTILNFYGPASFGGCDGFKRIWPSMPYIIRVDFKDMQKINSTELLKIDRDY